MSYSAANTHYMVSELRLLMSSLQNDPVRGCFDPNLPPVFDVYPDEEKHVSGSLECPCLHDQFEPSKIIKESEANFFISENRKEEDNLAVNFDEVLQYGCPLSIRNSCGFLNSTEEHVDFSYNSYYKSPLEIHMAAKLDGYFQSYAQPHHFFGSFKSHFSQDFSIKMAAYACVETIDKGVLTIIRVVRTNLVFDPGIDQRMTAIYEQPRSSPSRHYTF
ncbi:hypothetical protein RND81_11G075600 [Saponaria officinalis]|uniref:Uncharacterized protein n=1 Tax=Saponaria officinalis TaxID=3572 RepID=A0AAW1HJB0_SAPOF